MKKKLLDDPRVIAGLFKEAMFYSRPLQVAGRGFSESALITDFHETSGRSKNTGRTVFFTFTGDKANYELIGNICEVMLHCHFVHFSGSCITTIERCEDGQYRAVMPQLIEVFNRRAQKRISPICTEKIFLPLVIQCGGLHTEGQFTLENTSAHGVGGVLKVMASVPINIGSITHGKWITPKGSLSISGKILRVELLEKGKAKTESVYRVGIQQESAVSHEHSIDALSITKKERRSSRRVFPKIDIQSRSPINPSHFIQMRINDASVSGFSCKLIDAADAHLLPAGCGVTIEDLSLIAELVGISGELLRFQFTHGSNQDRLYWLKKLANFQNSNTFTSSGIGSELMELFCESGASAAGFLKMQSPFAQAFDNGLASKIQDGEWMHRWIERTASGEVRGHTSAVQIADNLWHVGDLAGMIPTERKLSLNFFTKFKDSFREFCISSSPCPKIAWGYVADHPLWQDFDQFLRAQKGIDAPIIVETKYHRFSPLESSTAGDVNDWSVQTISAKDHEQILTVLEKCTFENAKKVLYELDFNVTSFGSPRLTRAILQSGHLLRRQYLLIKNDESLFVYVLQSFPYGSSQNRTTDVGWLIPVTGLDYNPSLRKSLGNVIQKIAREHGFSSPGYIELLDPDRRDNSSASKNMTWAFYHPRFLEFFRMET